MEKPIPQPIENDDWEWTATIYASKQPRGNAHWESIIACMFIEIDRYRAFMDEARS